MKFRLINTVRNAVRDLTSTSFTDTSELDTLKNRCAALESELLTSKKQIDASISRIIELEDMLRDLLNTAHGDGREPSTPQAQSVMRRAASILKTK